MLLELRLDLGDAVGDVLVRLTLLDGDHLGVAILLGSRVRAADELELLHRLRPGGDGEEFDPMAGSMCGRHALLWHRHTLLWHRLGVSRLGVSGRPALLRHLLVVCRRHTLAMRVTVRHWVDVCRRYAVLRHRVALLR